MTSGPDFSKGRVIAAETPAPGTLLHFGRRRRPFGRVLVMQGTADWESAMRLCNGVPQGLVAAIFTNSGAIVRNFLDEAEAGMLKVNQSTSGAAVDSSFGGWKASGVGPPEHGPFDVEFFTRPQTVYGEASKAGGKS